jgi:hypothetical protein
MYVTNFEIVPNATDRFFLCTKREKETIPVCPVSFFVYDAKSDSIVYEREIDNGKVRWLDSFHLSITTIPGNITGDEDPATFIEIHDVVTGRTSNR